MFLDSTASPPHPSPGRQPLESPAHQELRTRVLVKVVMLQAGTSCHSWNSVTVRRMLKHRLKMRYCFFQSRLTPLVLLLKAQSR